MSTTLPSGIQRKTCSTWARVPRTSATTPTASLAPRSRATAAQRVADSMPRPSSFFLCVNHVEREEWQASATQARRHHGDCSVAGQISSRLQEQPRPLWQLNRREMQLLPHAFPSSHIRQHCSTGVQRDRDFSGAGTGVAARRRRASGSPKRNARPGNVGRTTMFTDCETAAGVALADSHLSSEVPRRSADLRD